jgi:hypothetical protein
VATVTRASHPPLRSVITRSIEDHEVVSSRSVHRWLLLLALLAVASCRDSGAAPPPTTTTTLLPETTVTQPATTTTLGFEVPAVIDVEYVQRVLETIYHLDGEATRRIYANKLPDADFNARLEAIYGDPMLSQAKRILGENAAEGFTRFANPPGDAVVRVVEVIQATPDCIVARANLDYRPQYNTPIAAEPQAVIQLARADVIAYNPTGWGVVVAGSPDPGTDVGICR